MLVDWRSLKANARLAEALLTSQAGVLLHELGHYVAANSEVIVPGHIVLTTDSGAFLPLHGLKAPSSDQFAFACAAGALAEQHFCGTTLHRRLGQDVARYVKVRPPVNPETRLIDIVDDWKRTYSSRMALIAACVEMNFDRCMDFVARRRFLIDELHVIPSAVLKLPYRRTWTAWFSERRATMETACRRHVATLCTADRMLGSPSEP